MNEDEQIAPEQVPDDFHIPDRSDMKADINNLIWRYCDPRLQIWEADRRAMKILQIIGNDPSATGDV